MEQNKVNRETILEQAVTSCLREMYRKSQPTGDYDEYVRKLQSGEIKEEPGNEIYRRHYLSQEEGQYIIEKHIIAYGMRDYWNDNLDTLLDFFDLGKKEITVKEGDFPNRREIVSTGDLSERFEYILQKYGVNEEDIEKMSSELKEMVKERVEECRAFYRHNREEHAFKFTIWLGCGSPTCNKEVVKKYWASQGANIEIVEHNPDKFWENDFYDDKN